MSDPAPTSAEADRVFLAEAVRLAVANVAEGGGPFAALVVKDETIVGRGGNRVTRDNDPTAHAEVVAIRDACARLGSFQLTGCTVYASCEPCPMCLAALYWARPARVVYAATAEDAAAAGFDDRFIVEEFLRPREARSLPVRRLVCDDAMAPFRAWAAKEDRIPY
ncbi:MAG: nucleoside deaminase [Elioraea sp.]|nr:nucleoside deaminase [Elioraea sp.]